MSSRQSESILVSRRSADCRGRPVRVLAIITMVLALSVFALAILASTSAAKEPGDESPRIPILVYHRFGPAVADSMTVTTPVFESHLRYLRDNHYTVIPLRRFVDYLLGKGPPPPARSVVITADDGHRSVFTYMLPLVKRYNIPVTLFIYPSAISNASYAMTWDQLSELQQTSLFDIQSHSYWHPNFRKEKRRLTAAEYEKLIDMQLTKSKSQLEKRLGGTVEMLSWPFGICDNELNERARKAGYIAAFTLERRSASQSDNIMEVPRYLMTDAVRGKAFGRLVAGESAHR